MVKSTVVAKLSADVGHGCSLTKKVVVAGYVVIVTSCVLILLPRHFWSVGIVHYASISISCDNMDKCPFCPVA